MPSAGNGRACESSSQVCHAHYNLQLGQEKLQWIEMSWAQGQQECEPEETEAESHAMGAIIMTHN